MTGRAATLGLLLALAARAADAPPLCSDAWNRAIEARVPTGDSQGHGPDPGSDEWRSVVEFKLGVRGKPGVPPRDGEAWCAYVDRLVRARRPVHGPAFSCDEVEPDGIPAMVCGDEELSALDRKLADVYAAAAKKATNEHPPVLKAEQRGWIKGRDDCWKSDDQRACVHAEYERRIAELQARYRLVPHEGPVRYVCDGNPANEVVGTFFRTTPPTLLAERGDDVSLMYLQPSGSGAKYQGRNESFWEHQGEALITWGPGAPGMRCTKAAAPMSLPSTRR